MITVTGRYVDLANRPVNGYVSLTPLTRVAGGGWIVVGATVNANIVDGFLVTSILADSADLSGDLYVHVAERLNGERQPPTYIVKPTGATLDLGTAEHLVPPRRPEYPAIPASALGQPGGVATLGSDGVLTLSQRPPAGGGSHGELSGLADDDHPQYFNSERLAAALDGLVPVSAVGAPNGVAPLGADGRLAASFLPGTGVVAGAFEHVQHVPQAVITVTHGLGYRPSVSVFSLDWSVQYDEYQTRHLSIDQLRVSMDQPSACVLVMS